jgi:sulfoxide reductase heme-binding subunit YedZ
MTRRLGGERWRRLHRLVYVAAAAGVVHYLWLVKVDILPPLVYAAILAVLLGARVWFRFVKKRSRVLSSTNQPRGVAADTGSVG